MEKTRKATRMLFAACLSMLRSEPSVAQDAAQWQPVGDKIKSRWVKDINPANPLPEYPRPQLVREGWQNLNGLWEYAIVPGSLGSAPETYEGQILVPYAVESSLSGVGRTVGKDSSLWYRREITISKELRKQRVLLHFGAVDWRCAVYVNGKKVGTHEGGFDPFSFDITDFLNKGAKQQITVGVWDPTDEGPQPNGKQVVNPHGIWYTPVTGIWQTVWLEGVPETYVASTKQTPDIDKGTLLVNAAIAGAKEGDEVRVSAWKGSEKVAEQTAAIGSDVSLSISNPELWSPDSPFRYGLK